jgi:hypothetical protein
MREDTDAPVLLDHAEQVQASMRRAGRWYAALVAAIGLYSIGIMAWMPVAHGAQTGLVAVACAMGAAWWKFHNRVRPASRRDMVKWVVPWAVMYVAAVTWFGPTYLDHTVGWWALMGAVVAIPAFTEAARAWSRTRR